jgi:hypothetical protein
VTREQLFSLARGEEIRDLRREAGELRPLALDRLIQPDVLDRDDDVVGEGLEESDLRVAERADLVARNRDCPDHSAVAEHRNGKGSSVAARFLKVVRRVLRVCEYVCDVHYLLREQRAPDHRPTLRNVLSLANESLVVRLEGVERDDAVHVAVLTREVAVLGLAELDRAIDHGLEHDVEVERRLRDRLYHVLDGRGAQLRAFQLLT